VTHLFWLRSAQCFLFMFRLSLLVTNLASISCLACRCLRRTYSCSLLQLCDAFVLVAVCPMLPFHVSLVVACGAPSFHFMFGLSMPGDALTVAARTSRRGSSSCTTSRVRGCANNKQRGHVARNHVNYNVLRTKEHHQSSSSASWAS
jgi:hypothetical protein